MELPKSWGVGHPRANFPGVRTPKTPTVSAPMSESETFLVAIALHEPGRLLQMLLLGNVVINHARCCSSLHQFINEVLAEVLSAPLTGQAKRLGRNSI